MSNKIYDIQGIITTKKLTITMIEYAENALKKL